MNPVQYILLNKGASMSAGKLAAQAAHASVEGVRASAKEPWGNPWDSTIVNRWYQGGHYAKIILEVADEHALRTAKEYIEARGFKTALIIDEGRTELDGLTPTALGVEVLDKDEPHVRATFGAFKLYTEEPQQPKLFVIERTDRIPREDLEVANKLLQDGRVEEARRYLLPERPSPMEGMDTHTPWWKFWDYK